jgi:hypothetical protein
MSALIGASAGCARRGVAAEMDTEFALGLDRIGG